MAFNDADYATLRPENPPPPPGTSPSNYVQFNKRVLHRPVEFSQFIFWAFTQRAQQAGLLPSLGSVGDPYDNPAAESFWGRMQIELLNRQRWDTPIELAKAMFENIAGFHNSRRRHSYFNCKTPIEFEKQQQALSLVS